MNALDLNIEYNARKTVLDHEQISARWDEAATQYRREADAELDIPYGESARSIYDFFPGPEPDAPLCVFIHGGYWRSRNGKTFSHIAKGLNGRGISLAIPTYDLVPKATVLDIVDQMRGFLVTLWKKTAVSPVVAGHSAGGHLAGAMLATNWARITDVPDDLVTRAFALSGLFDLHPLLRTDINDDVRLTRESAVAASPVFWPAPRDDLRFVAAVGADESSVFKEQSRRVVEVWREAGMDTDYLEVPDCNHFTMVDAVSTPGTMLFERLASMIESHAAH